MNHPIPTRKPNLVFINKKKKISSSTKCYCTSKPQCESEE